MKSDSGMHKEIVDMVLSLYTEGLSKAEIGRRIIETYGLNVSQEAARKKVSRIIDNHSGMSQKASEVGLPPGNVKSYWYKDKNYSIQVRVPEEDLISWDEILNEFESKIEKHKPVQYERMKPHFDGGHLLVIDPADVHVGKLSSKDETGDDYDSETAIARMVLGIQKVVESASHYNIDQILFVGGNDVLHVDGPANATTGGTRQDVSNLWWQNFEMARLAYTGLIEYLRDLAPVHFVHNPSNHDYVNGYLLSRVVEAWFRLDGNVTFDVSMAHRKYYKYHNNLIGTTHGDGAKNDILPLLMAVEAASDWAECDHKYIYTHHVHHKTSKDFPGVTIESIRSISGSDSWHHKNGYQHAPKAMEGFVHDKKNGQVLRITHSFHESKNTMG